MGGGTNKYQGKGTRVTAGTSKLTRSAREEGPWVKGSSEAEEAEGQSTF